MKELKEYLKKSAKLCDSTLDELLPKDSERPESIHKLMRYSIFAGGKRVRPALLFAAHEACGGTFGDPKATKVASSIEMLHTFSLIHDDLPAMDDDDFRRGKPTAHKAFNEALAILGGDALSILAFEILCDVDNMKIIKEISSSIGTSGMIGGQVVDIESEGKPVTKEIVEYIHNNKTAALIRASLVCGAILANATKSEIEKISDYGNAIGLLFQVVDDILDEESTTEVLGKDVGSDKEKGKATFPAIVGMKESKKYADKLLEDSIQSISFLGEKGIILEQLAKFIRVRVS